MNFNNIVKKNVTSTTAGLIITIAWGILSVSYASESNNASIEYDRIKNEIKSELDKEMKKMAKRQAAAYRKMSFVLKRTRQMQARMQKEIMLAKNPKQISDSDLEKCIAGQESAGLDITGGYKRITETPSPADSTGQKTEEFKALTDASGALAKERALEQTIIDKGGMLLPRGVMQIEPSFTTAHFSSNRINIEGFSILPVLVIGEISTESVKRDVFIPSLTLRYGILKNFQGEVSVPYRFEFDRVTDNLGAESSRDANGLGDIGFGFSSQIAYEKGLIPDLVANVSVKTPSGRDPYNKSIGLGTGHWGIRGALIAVKSSDPVVIFGNVAYTWNIEKNVSGYGCVDPGDTISYAIGFALSLSYQTAINFQYQQDITSKMDRDGIPVNGSFLNSAGFKAGFSWAINEKVTIDCGVTIGATTDAPDYVAEVRMPITF